MSARKQRIVLWSFCAICSLGLLGLMAPAVVKTTNCGGNSAALAQCYLIACRVYLEAQENRLGPDVWSQEALREMSRLSLQHWTRTANYLVRTNIPANAPEETIVIVCDQPFGNVPKPAPANFYRTNPAHAVGYLSGTNGLISPAEFHRLDLSSFVNVATLKPKQP